jgi:Tfp pilus assembly protein PilO
MIGEKGKFILLAVITALVLILGGGAIYYFQFKVLHSKTNELEKIASDIKESEAKKTELNSLIKSVEEKKNELQALSQRIPPLDQGEYDRFSDDIRLLTQQSGIFITSTSFVQPKAPMGASAGKALPAGISKAEYELTCYGDFFSLINFLNLVENNKRFTSVSFFKITPEKTSEKGQSSINQMKLTVATYNVTEQPLSIAGPAEKVSQTTPIPK